MQSQYWLEFSESLKGPKMSKKSRSPGAFAFVNVDFGTAFARALASAHDPQGYTTPVSIQLCRVAIALTVQVSG